MKKIMIMFVVGLLTRQLIQAQGTLYLSSLSQASTGNVSVGSDSWLAAGFGTGNNVGGYFLNSIQLGMTDASGNPNGFTVMIYAQSSNPAAILPGSSLGTLTGSLNPASGGVYTYSAGSSITLSPSTVYFIVLTAATTVVNGAYEWNESAYPPSISNWGGVSNGVLSSSNEGSSWSFTPYAGIAQFAITATPVPEPSSKVLLILGGLLLLSIGRWKSKVVQ